MTGTFTWRDGTNRHGKRQWLLYNPDVTPSPLVPADGDHRLGHIGHHGGRVWEATYWLGYTSINHRAGTPARAARLLEAELDRRSIDLFGADVIIFEGSPR